MKFYNEEFHHICHFLLFLCAFYLKTPSLTGIIQCVATGRLVNNEFEKSWWEAVVAWIQFTVLACVWKDQGKPQKQKKFSHESRVLRQRFEVKAFQMQIKLPLIKYNHFPLLKIRFRLESQQINGGDTGHTLRRNCLLKHVTLGEK